MSGIYGRITEHPEYPIEDSRRFTVTIQPHKFVSMGPRWYEGSYPLCVCGEKENHSIHIIFEKIAGSYNESSV